MRKVLPPTPDMDTQMNLSAKMIDRRTSTPKGNHSYGPFFLEYSLLAEYNLLQKQKMPGVYVIPSYTSPLCWNGVIFVRQGLFQEGVFRFKMFIPDNYPDGDCPRLVFDHPVFHPAVDALTHELDLRRGFHKWKRNVNHIWQILLYARRAFHKIESKDAVNQEAADAYVKSPERFQSMAAACVAEWRRRLYDPAPTDDPHFITFAPFDPAIHEPARKAMMESSASVAVNGRGRGEVVGVGGSDESGGGSSIRGKSSIEAFHRRNTPTGAQGLSFIEPGETIQIFSREVS